MSQFNVQQMHPLIPREQTYSLNRKLVNISSNDRDISKWPNSNNFEVNDEEAYKDVWKGEMPLRASQERIYEYACHEGNYAMANILAGARAEEEQ